MKVLYRNYEPTSREEDAMAYEDGAESIGLVIPCLFCHEDVPGSCKTVDSRNKCHHYTQRQEVLRKRNIADDDVPTEDGIDVD